MTVDRFDIAVIGGGMIGAATALGLAKQGKTVAVVEGVEPKAFSADQEMDIRISAISRASVELLTSLQVWTDIESMRIHPYSVLETWELEGFNTRFDAKDLKLDNMGYMVENRILQLGLWKQLQQHSNIRLFCPDRIQSLIQSENKAQINLDSGISLECHLLVGADGANSKVRQLSQIGVTAWDYRQHCMLINVETDSSEQDTTWQWFTPHGPRSFLPLGNGQACLVWYDSPQAIQALSQLDEAQLQAKIIRSFPKRVGQVKVLKSASFPLKRRHAQTYYKSNVVLVGDAAHTINPLAGQGVNLGFKDVAGLLKVLDTNTISQTQLAEYQKQRVADNLIMQGAMDAFYLGFGNDILPLKMARNIGLKLANNAGAIKQQALKYALGL
ncbi:FAD-dependent oxidoreductase [Vibrio gallicus]|uniref:FAD-dependent oxidoreductase n=1 Tax=Vibrio gallicus TaxID=190897 RepID=UPI0021C39D66|nr:FAD-dependent oxidoreductase [Vibrio gallicus]